MMALFTHNEAVPIRVNHADWDCFLHKVNLLTYG